MQDDAETASLRAPNGGALDPLRIAVVIPTFNASRTIGRAVDSVRAQILPAGYALDIVIADDCSQDDTPRLLEQLASADDRIRIVFQSQNQGPSAARNLALQQTRADWFTPLDSDDYMAPGRLARLIETATTGDWDLVADNLLMSFEDSPEKVERTLWPGKPDGTYALTLERFVEHNLSSVSERQELGFLKPLIRRSALQEGPVYRGDMRFAEDYELYTRLLVQGGRACLIDPAGYHSVQHRNSLSRSQKAADFARLVSVDQDLLARAELTPAARKKIAAHLRESRAEWVWLRAIDAVKTRNVVSFLSCFAVSFSSSASLIARLADQIVRRAGAKLARKPVSGTA